jgi:hypothetical protein
MRSSGSVGKSQRSGAPSTVPAEARPSPIVKPSGAALPTHVALLGDALRSAPSRSSAVVITVCSDVIAGRSCPGTTEVCSGTG